MIATPSGRIAVREAFGIDSDLVVPAFEESDEHVPAIDPAYVFDHDVTLAVLSGFAYNRRVLVQGMHGTGKSTHVEQVAARLSWPCVRVNLDGQLSRMDLIGRDRVSVRNGSQVTEFMEESCRGRCNDPSHCCWMNTTRAGPTSCSCCNGYWNATDG